MAAMGKQSDAERKAQAFDAPGPVSPVAQPSSMTGLREKKNSNGSASKGMNNMPTQTDNSSVLNGIFILLLFIIWNTSHLDRTLTAHWIDEKGSATTRETFSADRQSGTVTSRIVLPNGEALYSGPKTNCRIVDARNWACDDAEELIESNDGRVSLGPGHASRDVNPVRWWIQHTWEWLITAPDAKK